MPPRERPGVAGGLLLRVASRYHELPPRQTVRDFVMIFAENNLLLLIKSIKKALGFGFGFSLIMFSKYPDSGPSLTNYEKIVNINITSDSPFIRQFPTHCLFSKLFHELP